MTNLQNSLFFS